MSDDKKKPRKVQPFEISIELRNPIMLSGNGDSTTYAEIPLREPTVDEISRFLKKNQKEDAISSIKFLITIVSGVPAPVVEKMGAMDYYKAQEYLLYFLTPPEEDDPEGNVEGSQ